MNKPLSKAKHSGMRCLVTGATGFIGSHLVSLLLKQGCQVAILLRPKSDSWRIQGHLSSLRVLEGTLAGTRNLRPQIQQFRPQVLIHAGWDGVAQKRRNEFDQISVNLLGSMELLSACLDAGCECSIGLGSQAEYGQTDKLLVEDMQSRPDTMYGAVKLCTGLLSQQMCAHSAVRFSWLRLTAAYGPKDNPAHLIPYVVTSLLRGKEPALTHGRQKWDYLHVTDVVNAIWSLARHSNARGLFNLSSAAPVSVRHICILIRDHIDPRLPLGFGKVLTDGTERMFLGASHERLQGATGWEPQVSLEDGIDDTIEWHREQLRLGI